jgi:hypothetical protein
MFAVTALYARSGWFSVPPVGDRLVWLALLVVPTAVGFWVGGYEWQLVYETKSRRRGDLAWLGLAGLLPFILWTVFQGLLGSLSGMIAGVQGLIILALVLATGSLLRRVSGRPWLCAFLQAALLYWLVLPQGVLFVM